jgi:acetyl esterase/lipase
MKNPRAILGPALAAALCSSPMLRAADPQVIDLWPEGVPGLHADATPEKTDRGGGISNVNHPTLTVLRPEAPNGTAVIVCPGGAYLHLSFQHEGLVPAKALNGIGVTAFIIKNRLKEYGQPAPLQDILRAIRLVRSRAAEFGVQPDRIGVLGFSAGGHLAASAGTLFDAPEGRTGAALDAVSGRPDFMMLIYPVITMEAPYAHVGSRDALLGKPATPELVRRWSLEQQVTKDSSPAFLVATEEDKTVPIENSLQFYEALRKAGVSAELHAFQKGPHGFGLNPGNGPTSEWPARAEDWMRFHGWLPAAK